MKKLTINVDMDGVIYSMMPALVDIAQRESVRTFMRNEGYPLPDKLDPFVSQWEIWESWGIPKKAFWKLFYLAIDEGLFALGDAVPGSVEAVSRLVKDGHRVRIVTSKNFAGRDEALKAQTDVLLWLNKHAPWAHKVEIAFSTNKQGYEADVIIDDKPTLAWKQKDRINVLFDQRWNEWVDAPGIGCWPLEGDRAYRAMNWEEVEYLIARIAARA